MPSPPPTPDRDGVPSSTTASSLAEVSTLSPDAVTVKVVARPTDTFPTPRLNVHDGSDCTSPIDYFRWPAPECDIRDEIQPPSNRSWRIGQNMLSSVVSGESSASPAELAGPLAFMLAWLFTMEECALDIGYDAAEWAELCRRTWTVFTKAELHSSLDLRKEVFMLTIEREFARWGRVMPVAQLAAAESRALPSHEHVIALARIVPIIQHHSVYPVSSHKHSQFSLMEQINMKVHVHPVHGPIHSYDQNAEALHMPDIDKDCNSLCRVVDVSGRV
jgi:hypothetical protein